MRRTTVAIASGLALVFASAALADSTTPANAPAPQMQPASATQDSSNPIICKSYVHEGDVIRTKDCRTKHQWEAVERQNREDVTETQLRSLEGTPMH